MEEISPQRRRGRAKEERKEKVTFDASGIVWFEFPNYGKETRRSKKETRNLFPPSRALFAFAVNFL
jgi:hypothetical protein